MANVIRHGGEAHTVRPDRVYRTSVLSPIMGYQPGVDVRNVLSSFALGPAGMTQLSGPGLLGPIQRLGLRIKAAWAARKARKFMFAGLGAPGPLPMQASQIAPQMQAQMSMLDHLMRFQNTGSVRGAVAQAAEVLSRRRPFTYYRAG